MRTGWGAAGSVGVLVLAAASICCAQSPASLSLSAQGEVVREIDDPHTGDRWLLVRNDFYPGGPGRLVLLAAARPKSAELQPPADGDIRLRPVIRAGDRLVIEEHTARVDALLEARALQPAAAGAALEARLTIGGRVARVVALGPGRAVFAETAGGRP